MQHLRWGYQGITIHRLQMIVWVRTVVMIQALVKEQALQSGVLQLQNPRTPSINTDVHM